MWSRIIWNDEWLQILKDEKEKDGGKMRDLKSLLIVVMVTMLSVMIFGVDPASKSHLFFRSTRFFNGRRL